MVNLAIYALMLVALFVGTWFRPAIALATLVCVQVLDVWGQLASPWLFKHTQFTNLFMVSCIGLGIYRAWLYGVRRHLMTPWVQILLTGLLMYAALSLWWTPAFKEGIVEWSKYWPYIIINVWVAPLLLRRNTDLYYGLSAILILGTGLAILFDVLVRWDARTVVTFWDSSTTIWNALAFAHMAGYVTMAAVLLNQDKSWRWSVIKYTAIAACIVLVLKSETRAQFFLMVIIPIVFLPLSKPVSSIKTYLSWIILAACVATTSIYAYDALVQEKRWSSQRVQSDWDIRVRMVSALLHHWSRASSQDPSALMLGLGNSASFSANIAGFHPHMVTLEVLGEEGLIGVGLLALLLWASWRTMRAAYGLVKHDPMQRGIMATLAATFLFDFLLSFKSGSLVGFGTQMFLFIVLMERQVAILAAEKHERAGDQQLQAAAHYSDSDLVKVV
ncbi:MAG: hypothetical protein AABZ34_00825 [Nitrospirota bacterium]